MQIFHLKKVLNIKKNVNKNHLHAFFWFVAFQIYLKSNPKTISIHLLHLLNPELRINKYDSVLLLSLN